jgi:hypothetical protein
VASFTEVATNPITGIDIAAVATPAIVKKCRLFISVLK